MADLQTRTIAAQLCALALPNIVSNLATPLISLVDTVVAGHLADEGALSAVAIGTSCFLLLYGLFIFLRKGTTGLAAQALGAGDTMEIKCTGARSVALALLLGTLLIALRRLLVVELIFQHWIKPPSDVVALRAEEYVFARLYGAPFALGNYALTGLLNGAKRPRDVLRLQLILNGGNAVLCVLLAWGCGLGVAGIGYAASLANGISFCIGLGVARSAIAELESSEARASAVPIAGPTAIALSRVLNGSAIARMFSISATIMVRSLLLTLVITSFTGLAARLSRSDLGHSSLLAGNLLLLQLHDLVSTGTDGFSNAAEVLVGESIGQKNEKRLGEVLRESLRLGLVIAACYSVLYLALGRIFFGLMTDDTDIVDVAATFLHWLVLGPFVAVWAFLFDGFFVGATLAREMMIGMLLATAGYVLTLEVVYFRAGAGDVVDHNNRLWFCFYAFMGYRAVALLPFFPALKRQARRFEACPAHPLLDS